MAKKRKKVKVKTHRRRVGGKMVTVMAHGRTVKVSHKRTGKSDIKKDRHYKALPAGKRISRSGNVYHETRRNRSDSPKGLI